MEDLPTALRDFLVSRRARLSPEAAGVQAFGGSRRVPGLRREEVAFLAGVSVDYYTRFERGRLTGVSDEIVEAVAHALHLDEAERQHLRNLVRASHTGSKAASARHRQATGAGTALLGLQAVLDSMSVPAIVQNARMDMVASNHLGRALYPFGEPGQVYNHSRFMFLDPRAAEFYRDYDRAIRNNVAILRAAIGRDPHDPELIQLVGQLTTQSATFRQLMGTHNVVQYSRGIKQYRHPLVGDVDFSYETLEMPAYPGLVMLVYTVERGSRTEEAMHLLASWTFEAPLETETAIIGTRHDGSEDSPAQQAHLSSSPNSAARSATTPTTSSAINNEEQTQ